MFFLCRAWTLAGRIVPPSTSLKPMGILSLTSMGTGSSPVCLTQWIAHTHAPFAMLIKPRRSLKWIWANFFVPHEKGQKKPMLYRIETKCNVILSHEFCFEFQKLNKAKIWGEGREGLQKERWINTDRKCSCNPLRKKTIGFCTVLARSRNGGGFSLIVSFI